METTQMSINKLAAKQIVVCSYSEILFSREKEQSSDACHNLGQAWNILPVTKGHVLYDSFIWKSRLGKSIEAESRPVVTEGRGCEGCV